MARPRRPARDLRIAIDCLPPETKHAMLAGVATSPIIVGAYTDREGGVCPMLAAHRHGGRTSFASFARAWDRYTRAGNGSRPATERELLTLRAMLEASVALDVRGSGEFAQAISEHRAAAARRPARTEQGRPEPERVTETLGTGDRDRAPELRHRPGWSWLRLFRRYDEYERALRELEKLEREQAADADERELDRV